MQNRSADSRSPGYCPRHRKVHRLLGELDSTLPQLPFVAWVPLSQAFVRLNVPADYSAPFCGTESIA